VREGPATGGEGAAAVELEGVTGAGVLGDEGPEDVTDSG
jgi:hypothetical protein